MSELSRAEIAKLLQVGGVYKLRCGLKAPCICIVDSENCTYPVLILCNRDGMDSVVNLTKEGYYSTNYKTSQSDIIGEWIEPPRTFEKDEKVYVRNYEGEEWDKKHYSHYENGTHFCFSDGLTSWVSEGATTPWKFIKGANE